MKRIDPKEQFSKKLATWTARFWFLYMVITAVMCVIDANISDAAVYLAICSSVVMLINVWAYTRNSVYEKAILAGMEKAKIGLTWKKSISSSDGNEDADDMEVDPDEEGVSNG